MALEIRNNKARSFENETFKRIKFLYDFIINLSPINFRN